MNGFTLVELAIVLTIVALIGAGILAGQDLVTGARLRGVITDLDQIRTASNTFQVKYGCIPGDCARASAIFAGALNGDGDGLLEAAGFGSTVDEHTNFFSQLNDSGFLDAQMNNNNKAYRTCSYHAYSNYGIYEWVNGTLNVIHLRESLPAAPWHGPCLRPSDGFAIDSKLDDGVAARGNIRAFTFPNGTAPTGCLTASSWAGINNADYLLDSTQNACLLAARF